MGYLKAQHLSYPDSSVIEAVGYAVLPNERAAEVIWVETNFGKIYEYVAYDGDGKDYRSEFNKIAHGGSAGRAWHEFKRTNRPTQVLEPGSGEVWREYELVLDEPDEAVETDVPVNVEEKEDPRTDETIAREENGYNDAPLRVAALGSALEFALISKNNNLDEVITNASKILAYLKG